MYHKATITRKIFFYTLLFLLVGCKEKEVKPILDNWVITESYIYLSNPKIEDKSLVGFTFQLDFKNAVLDENYNEIGKLIVGNYNFQVGVNGNSINAGTDIIILDFNYQGTQYKFSGRFDTQKMDTAKKMYLTGGTDKKSYDITIMKK